MAGSKLPPKLPTSVSKLPQAHPSKLPPPPPLSSKIPPPLSSTFPAASRAAHDTGPHMLLDGDLYYRQIDELVLHVCVARTISNAKWREFLETSLRLTRKLGRTPKAALAAFTLTYPDAKQRLETREFLKANGAKPVDRLGIVSDSPLIRGATVAYTWLVPGATTQAFGSKDAAACLKWLHEGATFDVSRAESAWTEAREGLRLP